jgi:HK97 family phage major capsid protein
MRDLEARAKVAGAMREIVQSPEDAGDLSAAQEERFEILKAELAATEKRIDKQALLDDVDRRMSGTPLTNGDDRFETMCRGFSLVKAIAAQIEPRSVDAGREIEVSQELARRSGRAARGIRVPLSALVEQRVTMVETGTSPTAPGASYLVGTDHLASEYVDQLRAATVVGASGARILTGLVGNLSIPKAGTGPAAEWVAEGSALTGGDYEFEQLTAEPHHVGVLTEWSRRVMLQASPAIEQLVRADFQSKLALAVDLAALTGAGSTSAVPEGISVNSDTHKVTTGLADYEDVIDVQTLVEDADVPLVSMGWVTSAAVKAMLRTTLMTSEDTASNFISDGNTLGGYPLRITSQLTAPVTSPVTPSTAIFGSWSQLIVCFWGDSGADILVNPYAATPYSKGNVQIRAFVDCDVIVRYPEAFAYVSGVSV